MSAIVPIPRIAINIRPATMQDLPFIDRLQKLHSKQVGWMPTKQLEGKIAAGHVLVAETREAVSGEAVKRDVAETREAVGGEAVKREEIDGFTASPLHRVTSVPLG